MLLLDSKVNKMKKNIILGLFLLIIQVAQSQDIKDINHQREGNKMLITYSISKAKFYQLFDIDVYVSLDNGQNFIGPLKEVEGDVGARISSGKNKQIYWDVFRELDQLKGEIIFDIRAKVIKDIDYKYFIVYQGNNISPYGLKFGHIGLIGWYVSVLTNTNFNMYEYEMDNDVVQDYPADQYYVLSDKKIYSRYSIVLGANYQFLKNLYVSAGVGYGHKELLYEFNEYSYSNDALLGNSYLINNSESYSGLEVEAGLMYKWNNFIFSGGGNILNFRRLDWNVGIGYCF